MYHNYTITTDHTNYPEPDDVVNAITGATGSVLLYLVTGTNDDNKQADTVMGATVAMEKGIGPFIFILPWMRMAAVSLSTIWTNTQVISRNIWKIHPPVKSLTS